MKLKIPEQSAGNENGYPPFSMNQVTDMTQLKSLFYCEPKFKLPRFSGGEYGALVENWFEVAEFTAESLDWTTDDIKISEFSKKFKNSANRCFQTKLSGVNDYTVFKKMMIKEFFSPINENEYRELWEEGLFQKKDESIQVFALKIRSVYVKAFGLEIMLPPQLYKHRTMEKNKMFANGLFDPEVKRRVTNYLYPESKSSKKTRRYQIPSWKKLICEAEKCQHYVTLKRINSKSDSCDNNNGDCTQVYIGCSASDQDAAYGLFFSQKDLKNQGKLVDDKKTCNVALLVGVTQAIKQAKKEGIHRMAIYSNSTYLLNSLKYWAKIWVLKNWHKSDGQRVSNISQWRTLLETLTGMDIELFEPKTEDDKQAMKEAKKLAVSAKKAA